MTLHIHADGIVNDRAPSFKAGDRVYLVNKGPAPYTMIHAGAYSSILVPEGMPVNGPSQDRTLAANARILTKPETPMPLVLVRRMAARLLPGPELAKVRKAINAFAAEQGADLAAGTYPRGCRPWLMQVVKDPAIAHHTGGNVCGILTAIAEINEAWTGPAGAYPWRG